MVLARRIIAVSPDKAFGKQLIVALKAAGGVVDAHQTFDELGTGELQAALIVMHLDGELAATAPSVIARLAGDTRVIAILPRVNLAAVVDIMQQSERVAGMMVAEELDTRQLSAMATRVLAGDIFGLEKLILWGTQVHSCLVGDYQEKSLCISQVSEFAELMGVRRKYRESIDQCLDEMLMNALYDAPVDDQGRQIFSEIPTRTRISLRVEQKAIVQYACDGKQFTLSVRDAFGTLERSTVLRYLHKCLHSEQQIDRKAGGAGLGLYLMTNASSEVYFNVLPGVATEAVCIFDLESPKLQLRNFGFFHETIDATGRLASGPSRRLPAGASHPVDRRTAAPGPSKAIIGILSVAIVATLVLVGIAAWPRLFGSAAPAKRASVAIKTIPGGATIEVDGKAAGTASDTLPVGGLEIGRAYSVVARLDGYEPTQVVVQPRDGDTGITIQLVPLAASVVIESTPSDASVEIDGKAAGVTPLTIATLAPGTSVTIVLHKSGFQDATAKLDVPKAGKAMRLVQPLAVSLDLARVRLVSDPPGAQVIQNGQLVAGVVTPAEILVEAGRPVAFRLTLPNKVPAVIEPFTPGRGDDLERSGKLVDGVIVRVTANLDGKVSITNAAHCQALPTPAECTLAPGTHIVELGVPGATRIVRSVAVAAKPIDVKIELGYVEAGPGKLIKLGAGPGVRRAVFEVGSRRVLVSDAEGTRTVSVVVKSGTTVVVN